MTVLSGNSTVAMWNTATGAVDRQHYYPYGQIRQTDGLDTKVGFTGQRHDTTGLMYYQARYYDPHIGRFTQPDTIIPGGGTDPQGLNRYTYVNNNPINNTDPTGHDPCPGGGGGCGEVRKGDENGDGTVPIRGSDCGAGCGSEAFWCPTIGISDGCHMYTPAPFTDEVQAAADAADHAGVTDVPERILDKCSIGCLAATGATALVGTALTVVACPAGTIATAGMGAAAACGGMAMFTSGSTKLIYEKTSRGDISKRAVFCAMAVGSLGGAVPVQTATTSATKSVVVIGSKTAFC